MALPFAPDVPFVIAPGSRPSSPASFVPEQIASIEARLIASDYYRRKNGSLHADLSGLELWPPLLSTKIRGSWEKSPWRKRTRAELEQDEVYAWEGLPDDEDELESRKRTRQTQALEGSHQATFTLQEARPPEVQSSSRPPTSTHPLRAASSASSSKASQSTLLAGSSAFKSSKSAISAASKSEKEKNGTGVQHSRAWGNNDKSRAAMSGIPQRSASPIAAAVSSPKIPEAPIERKRSLGEEEEVLFELGNTQMELPTSSSPAAPFRIGNSPSSLHSAPGSHTILVSTSTTKLGPSTNLAKRARTSSPRPQTLHDSSSPKSSCEKSRAGSTVLSRVGSALGSLGFKADLLSTSTSRDQQASKPEANETSTEESAPRLGNIGRIGRTLTNTSDQWLTGEVEGLLQFVNEDALA